MEALFVLMVIVAGIGLLGVAAAFGVDSREGSTDPRQSARGIVA